MSFNQLPDELIAHIGTCLSSEDNCQLAQSQKRIHRVLKKDGLIKPEAHEIYLCDDYSNEYLVYTTEEYSKKCISITRTFSDFDVDDGLATPIGKILNEFRSIGTFSIGIDVKDDVGLRELLKSKTKINCLQFTSNWIYLDDWKTFITACKKFPTNICHAEMQETFYSDEVIIPLLPITTLNLHVNDDTVDEDCEHPNLTDRTLEALVTFNGERPFIIEGIRTAFTTKGIRNLVERLVEKQAWHGNFNFGVLNSDEEPRTQRWVREVGNIDIKAKLHHYTMSVVEHKCEWGHLSGRTYAIRFDECWKHRGACIEFFYKY